MRSKTPNKTNPGDPAKDAGDGKTKVEQGGQSAPRLPHERDQSSDSQQTQDGQPSRVSRQAHDDVERGLVDTDLGLEANRVPETQKVRR